ncbi:MAG: peptidyl-prolyl cis-trans isomerase, partial [Muribaculaceae bacterium]|nr:peptidyl-prolyl cis-trans isomerase [Muribaculaceae bacterium]
PITLGEFEYLYHKNNSQQLEPQTIEQYLDMFINYKLKVAEAQVAGIDTTATFTNELRGYARDLAEPYLTDKAIEQKLIDDVYNRLQEEVHVSHIMIPLVTPTSGETAQYQLADSLRNALLDGADFSDIALRYSVDRSTSAKGGDMGFITAARFPYTFEEAAYNTPVGTISSVVRTPFGFHIIKPTERRKARGQVLVQHILKLTQGMSATEKAVKKQQIDSLHNLLVNGADFDQLAARNSEDPGSARQGGRLPWFSTGRMVKEFEETSFALNDGELSQVIESPFGYHIIHRLDSKDIESKEELTPAIKSVIAQDEREKLPRKAILDNYCKKYNVTMNRPALAMIESLMKSNGGCDSTVMQHLASMNAPAATYDGGSIPVNIVAASMVCPKGADSTTAYSAFTTALDNLIDSTITEKAITDMPATNTEYRNLLNEYRDGILLFEISDRKVWSRAKEDTKGLDKWFADHRKKYTWPSPKFKSYVIFATSDSVLNVARNFLATHPIEGKDLSSALRQLCGKDIRVERVIAAKGENAIVDYLGFNGEKPAPQGKWTHYEAYRPVIIDAPTEVADERGAITTDYQNYLEEQWIKEMRSRHKIKINKKVLKEAK